MIKALEHSAMRCERKLNIVWIDSDHLEDSLQESDSSKYYSAWSKLTASSGSKWSHRRCETHHLLLDEKLTCHV